MEPSNYTNTFATSFDVPTQTINTTNSRGRGTITYSGTAFSSFSFDHAQQPARNGFVIDSVTIDTVSAVPLPASLPLIGLGALGVAQRRKHSAD